MRVLLVGQPNCGKTTLFNRLTGRRERTGNRAGVTVEGALGRLRGTEAELVDLPGLYGLAGGGPEEQAARKALLDEGTDFILNVVDSTALTRGLALTVQLAALKKPMAVLLNMADEAKKQGLRLDPAALSRAMGAPVYLISARTGEGLTDPGRWLRAGRTPRGDLGADPFAAARRLGALGVKGGKGPRPRGADRWLLHPVWGLPLFALILGLVFLISFQWAGPWLARGVEGLTAALQGALAGTALDYPLLREGLLGSAGYVLSFLPVIGLLSLLLTLLEDVGYLPRAAFLLDGWLKKLGLDGRCAVPLLLGFGCTVPALMAARTLGTASRRRTGALLPFVPCSAKLPFLLLLGSRMIPHRPARGALLLCGLSLVMGVISGTLMKSAGPASAFALELPPLRLPRWQSVAKETEVHLLHFFRRAGRVLLPASVALWGAMNLGPDLRPLGPGEESLLFCLGRLLLPLLRPLGLSDGRAGVILLMGLGAKESMAAAAALFAREGMTLTGAQAAVLGAVAVLLPPCLGALGTMRGELGKGFTARLILRQVLIAYGCGWILHALLHLLGGRFP